MEKWQEVGRWLLTWLSARVLRDRLGPLTHRVLSELPWQQESHSCLNLSAAQRLLPVVPHKLRALQWDLLEDIVDEAVHDRHAPLADSDLWVHLLQHSVDVDWVGLLSLPVPVALGPGHGSFGLGARLCLLLLWGFRWALRGFVGFCHFR